MIPKRFVDRHVEKIKDMRFRGVKLEDLTREELEAAIVYLYEKSIVATKEKHRQMDMLIGLSRG